MPGGPGHGRITSANLLVRKGDIKFQERHTLWADSSFFSVFDFPLKYGDPRTALKEPNSVVFTETAARKYFGDSNPVGQPLLLMGRGLPVHVTGVMKDIPENSHIKADMLVSMRTYAMSVKPWIEDAWEDFDASTYLLLSPGADPAALQAKLPAVSTICRRAAEKIKYAVFGENRAAEGCIPPFRLRGQGERQPGQCRCLFPDRHLHFADRLCQFYHLTTARSAERAKEVGIRKCAGALKRQLLVSS